MAIVVILGSETSVGEGSASSIRTSNIKNDSLFGRLLYIGVLWTVGYK